jgi:hypothetical protein
MPVPIKTCCADLVTGCGFRALSRATGILTIEQIDGGGLAPDTAAFIATVDKRDALWRKS